MAKLNGQEEQFDREGQVNEILAYHVGNWWVGLFSIYTKDTENLRID